jgi:hypothetical protein
MGAARTRAPSATNYDVHAPRRKMLVSPVSKSCFRLVNFLAAYEANAASGSHFCQIAERLDEGEQDGGSLVHFADANLAGDCQLGCWASSLMV